MKAIYWKNLKEEDKRYVLSSKDKERNTSILATIGFLILSYILVSMGATGTQGIRIKNLITYIGNNTLTDTIETDSRDFGNGIEIIGFIFISICLINLIITSLESRNYKRFLKRTLKYATIEVKLTKWVKDKIDGEII